MCTSLTIYTLENPPMPMHLINSKSLSVTLADLGSLGLIMIGSICKGWIGNPASKLKGLSGLDKIKSTGIEIPVVLIP